MVGTELPGKKTTGTPKRKAEHLRINLEEDVSAKGITTGFENYRFMPRALPQVNFKDVSTTTELFRHSLGAPIFISCMTGGVAEAQPINIQLAETAQHFRLAIGLGSGRVLLEHPEVLPTFNIRPYAPDCMIFANLGAIQLNKGVTVDQCRYLVDLLHANALVLHLNALQEALQPEGDTDFSGLLSKIELLCQQIEVPVIAKEVGWGIAPDDVRALIDAGVSAVDVAGAGGTSWSEVERHRLNGSVRGGTASAFANWGLPTADAVRLARRAAPNATIFASGGVRSGMDVAKAIALGANLVGAAGPFLRAAAQGEQAIFSLAEEFIDVLRTTMFCVGADSVEEFRRNPRLAPIQPAGIEISIGQLSYSTVNEAFIDITADVDKIVQASGIRNGFAQIYSKHTTAAIRINENEPLLMADFTRLLERISPCDGSYDHDQRIGIGPDEPRNGHAHCQHLLLSSSESVPVIEGELNLGKWQRIFLVELNSPRQRQITVEVVGS